MQRRSRLSHIPALDGVRGIAVVGVLFFHAGHLSGGFLGVDLFFTLSGFLITSLLIAEWREHGTVRLGAFWARRARRLLPALFMVLTLAALYAALLAGDTELGRLRGDAFASLFYVSNWWQIGHRQSYWDIFTAGSPLAHMWSLAIEEQFYVVWPLLFFAVTSLARRRALRWLFVVTAMLTAASAVAMVWLHHAGSDPTRVYEGSDTRAASILVGCLAAMLVAGRGDVIRRPARVAIETAGCVAAIGIAWSWFTIDGLRSNDLFEGGLFLHSLAGAVLITAAAHPVSPVLGRLLSLRPLRFLGTISYGIYLYHLPVYVALTPERAHLRGWPLDGVHLVVTLAIAVSSYHFVEQPIRRGALGRQRAPKALAAAVVAVTAALVASTVGAVSVSASSLGPAGAPTLNDPPTTTTTTTTTAPVADGTTSTTAAGRLPPRRVSVVGDSVAWTIGVGLDAIKTDRDVAVQNEGVWGCGISRGDGKVRLKEGQIVTEAATCPQWPQRWGGDLASFHPDDVVLVLGAWDLADRTRNGSWTHPCADGFDEWWAGEFDEALRVLGTTGATVHVTTTPFLRSNVLGVSQAETDKRVVCLNTVIRAGAAARGVDVIDLAGWVCPAGACVDKVDTTVLRPDGVHYDGPGGPIVAGWLLDRLEPRIATKAVTSTIAATTTSTTAAPTTTTTEVPTPTMPMLRTVPDAPDVKPAARSRPLRVLFVGDSYLFDLQWGARAGLEAAGVVVDTLPRLGFNLADTRWDWKAAWRREVTRFKPDVVVAVWGIIDVDLLRGVGVDGYQHMLDDAIDLLSARHATVVLFGLAASVNDDRGSPPTLNDVWSAVPARRAGVIYVDPDPILSPHGVPEATFTTAAGTVRVRKPDGDHFCPGGSLRFGQAMLELANAWWSVRPPSSSSWETGDWRAQPAYVDAPGACPGP